MISAQVMDMTVLAVFGRTCGLEFYPKPFFLHGITCVYTPGDGRMRNYYYYCLFFFVCLGVTFRTQITLPKLPTGSTPFQGIYILSIGFILVFMLTIPVGFLNLNDNMVCDGIKAE